MANHSQQQNTTTLSTSECIAWLTVYSIQAVAIVTLNALTAIIYLRVRSLRKRSMYLVINQAVADMFVGASLIHENFILGKKCAFWTFNVSNSLYFITVCFQNFFPIASLINLAAISLERTHATFRPLRHRLIRKKIFGAAVAIVWITDVIISTSIILIGALQPLTLKLLDDFNISYASVCFFCLLIIVVSYSSIAIKVVFGTQPHHHGATHRQRKLTKTLFIVTVVSILLTLPIIILRACIRVGSPTSTIISLGTIRQLDFSFTFLYYTNSLVNTVLYTFRMSEFRRALFAFFHCRSQSQLATVFTLNEM